MLYFLLSSAVSVPQVRSALMATPIKHKSKTPQSLLIKSNCMLSVVCLLSSCPPSFSWPWLCWSARCYSYTMLSAAPPHPCRQTYSSQRSVLLLWHHQWTRNAVVHGEVVEVGAQHIALWGASAEVKDQILTSESLSHMQLLLCFHNFIYHCTRVLLSIWSGLVFYAWSLHPFNQQLWHPFF